MVENKLLPPPPAKVWAEEHNIEVLQPDNYKDENLKATFEAVQADVFVVVAYNHLLPDWLINLPKHGSINLHPSLLPQLRGASPIRTAIKDDLRDAIGVTIMLLDSEMDHGPILDQMHMPIADENWPVPGPELDEALAHMGGALLADALPAWTAGEIIVQEQDHSQATYCGKLTKADSQLDIDPTNLPTGKESQKNMADN